MKLKKSTLLIFLVIISFLFIGPAINSALSKIAALYFFDERLQSIIPRDGLNLLVNSISDSKSNDLVATLSNWGYVSYLVDLIPYGRQLPYLLFFALNIIIICSFYFSYLLYRKNYRIFLSQFYAIGIFFFAIPPFSFTAFLFPSKDLYAYLTMIYFSFTFMLINKDRDFRFHKIISIIVICLSFLSRIQYFLIALLIIFALKLKRYKYLSSCAMFSFLIYIAYRNGVSFLDYNDFLQTRGNVHSETSQIIYTYLSNIQSQIPFISAAISLIRFLLSIIGGYLQGAIYVTRTLTNPSDFFLGLPALQDLIYSLVSTRFIYHIIKSKGYIFECYPKISLLVFNFILVIGAIPYPQPRYFWPLIVPFSLLAMQNNLYKIRLKSSFSMFKV